MGGRNNPVMRNKEKKIHLRCLDSPALICLLSIRLKPHLLSFTCCFHSLDTTQGSRTSRPPPQPCGATAMLHPPPKNRFGVLLQQSIFCTLWKPSCFITLKNKPYILVKRGADCCAQVKGEARWPTMANASPSLP